MREGRSVIEPCLINEDNLIASSKKKPDVPEKQSFSQVQAMINSNKSQRLDMVMEHNQTLRLADHVHHK